MRQYRGDPRANVAATDDGRVADRHAGDIGDRVQRAVWQYANDDAEVAGPGRAVPRLLCVCREAVQADGDERHHHESGGASDVHDVIIYRRMAVTPLDGIVDALNLTVPVRARQ